MIMDSANNRPQISFEDKAEHKVFQANAVFYKSVLENYGFEQISPNKEEVEKILYRDCIYRDDRRNDSKVCEQKFWSDEFDDEFSSFYEEDNYDPLSRVDRKKLLDGTGVLVEKRNERERLRVKEVNESYNKLRKLIPAINGRNKRVSKVKTLKKALDYIKELQNRLNAQN